MSLPNRPTGELQSDSRAPLGDRRYGAKRGGFVYFIGPEALLCRSDPKVKIGFTTGSPFARLRSLQTGCPEFLDVWAFIAGTQELEAALHRTFDNLRSHGEWFYVQDKLHSFLSYLGDEPDIGNLISPERLEVALYDTVFSGCTPHPSVLQSSWDSSADTEQLRPFFPELWAECFA